MRARVLAVVLIALLLSGCYISVSDPRGHTAAGEADIIGASVDYRTATTTLSIDFGPGAHAPYAGVSKGWNISTDGEKAPEFSAGLGGNAYDQIVQGVDPGDWSVTEFGTGEVCGGTLAGNGHVGGNTVSLTFPSSCLAEGGELPVVLRIVASTNAWRDGADSTSWSGAVVRD